MTFDEWLDEIEVFASRLDFLHGDFPEVEDKEKLLKWLEAAYNVGHNHKSPVEQVQELAPQARIEMLENEVKNLRKALEVYERERNRFKHAKPEMTGAYFLAGGHGPKDDNQMPQFVEIVPAYGCGWSMVYEYTGRTIMYEGS